MGKALKLSYDAEGDILYIDTVAPHEGQRTSAVGEGVIVRSDADSGAVENVEIWAFMARASSEGGIEIPLTARLRETVVPSPAS
jgi:uncharacterized protein YuzE